MRVTLSGTAGILSALALLLVKETVSLLSTYRQASGAARAADPIVTCPEREVADLDCEFPFLYDLGTGVIVTLVLGGDPSFPALFPC